MLLWNILCPFLYIHVIQYYNIFPITNISIYPIPSINEYFKSILFISYSSKLSDNDHLRIGLYVSLLISSVSLSLSYLFSAINCGCGDGYINLIP